METFLKGPCFGLKLLILKIENRKHPCFTFSMEGHLKYEFLPTSLPKHLPLSEILKAINYVYKNAVTKTEKKKRFISTTCVMHMQNEKPY